MFFEALKLLWLIVAPANLLVLALAVGAPCCGRAGNGPGAC